MNAAHWLAVVMLAWFTVDALWEAIDKPVERTYHSKFFVVVMAAFNLAALSFAVGVLVS